MEKKTTALRKVKKMMDVALREKRVAEHSEMPEGVVFVNEDCRAFMRRCVDEGKKFHCCVTDPPWGVDLGDLRFQEANTEWDEQQHALELMEEAFGLLDQVLVEDAHVYVFFAMRNYDRVHRMLAKRWDVDWLPLIWNKRVGSSTMVVDQRYVSAYETIFFCRKGTGRKLAQRTSNVFTYDRVSKPIHPTQKPVQLLMQFIENSTVRGESVFDPFAGSGSTLRAARKLDRVAVGCESDEVMYAKALEIVEGGE